MRRALFAVLCLGLLTACDSTQSLQELRLATPPTDSYQAALAGDYQTYSEAQLAQKNWSESEYFADKGLVASHGGQIQPEDPTKWDIPTAALPEFTDARTRLLAAIEANKTTQPALTAAAVVDYDRWVVTSNSSDPTLANVTEAHDTFFNSLAKLEAVHMVQPGMDAPSSEPGAQQTGNLAPTILYFPFDSDALGKGASAAISSLAQTIVNAGKANVAINGHTDRAGTEQYNMNLSERRAKFVAGALTKAGAPAKELHTYGFGESDPAVPTADGVREPKNRRVEVVIEK